MSDTSQKESHVQVRAYKSTAVSTTRLIKTGDGVLGKVIVNSHSTGTFRLYDGVTAVNPIGGTYTPATGSSVIDLDKTGFDTGIFVVTGGTIDLTVQYF